MQDIKDLTLAELKALLSRWNAPSFYGRQIFSWIYKKGVFSFEQMSDLPKQLRDRLKHNFIILGAGIKSILRSSDGTEKFLIELGDAEAIECAGIPSANRVTGCISTQVGCKYSCKFCASGALGFKRNLTAGEIIEQILCLRFKPSARKLTHLVFMGIGEPLDNYENVLKAIRIINSPDALNIGARRITISTAGIIPSIQRLAEEGLQVELSVSLHAADEKTRSRIMPINKKYPLKELIPALKAYIEKTNRQVTFEYVLIKGINSDLQSARELVKILKGLMAKVNLIGCNPKGQAGFRPADKAEIFAFKDYLVKQGIPVTYRRPRGEDIEAACGQLRLHYEKT